MVYQAYKTVSLTVYHMKQKERVSFFLELRNLSPDTVMLGAVLSTWLAFTKIQQWVLHGVIKNVEPVKS